MLRDLEVSGIQLDLSQYLGLWAIDEAAFNAHWALLMDGGLLRHLAAGPRQQTEPAKSRADLPSIAQFEIRGTMTKNGSSLSTAGATTLLRRQIRSAGADADIDGGLLLIESPGGTVSGTQELAEDVEWFASQKPLITLYEDLGASAALWAGSMSRKVYAVNPHTTVGSMGVYMGLYDYSGAAAMKGIKPVLIRTGDLKGAGFPGAEFSDEQKAMYQRLVDDAHAAFRGSVQRARNLSDAQMSELGRGGVYTAKDAQRLGLIDGIRSYEAVVAELRGMVSPKRKRTMTESNTAASLPELKKALAGASDSFLMGQLLKNATLDAATADFITAQGVEILDLKKSIAAKDEEITTLKSDLEKAKKGGKHSAQPENPSSNADDEAASSAVEKFDTLVAAKVKAGKTKAQAISAVVKENKDLYAAYQAEVNAKRAS